MRSISTEEQLEKMSCAFNTSNIFLLYEKKIYMMGLVKMHAHGEHMRVPMPVQVYSRELQENSFVHISSCTSGFPYGGGACAISEGLHAAVYCWGRNNDEQQGPHSVPSDPGGHAVYVCCRRPIRRGREFFRGETPVSSASTPHTLLILTAEGGLWFSGVCPIDKDTPDLQHVPPWGFAQIPPHLFNGATITSVAAARFHYVAACSNGCVYVWGKNENFALAEKDDGPDHVNPHLKERVLFEGKFISRVFAGDNHSVVLSSDGNLFEWGQIHCKTRIRVNGIISVFGNAIPVRVRGTDAEFGVNSVQTASCGAKFVLILDRHSRVWSSGLGASGELGLARIKSSRHPLRLDNFTDAGDVVTEISAGNCNSAALTQNGNVYVWGRQHVRHESGHPMHAMMSTRHASEWGLVDAPMCIMRRDAPIPQENQNATINVLHPVMGADAEMHALSAELVNMILNHRSIQ